MPRIAVEVDLLVKDPLADFSFAPGRSVRAAAFVGAPGVEAKADEIARRLCFQNHCICPRIECAGILRTEGLLDGFASDAFGVELCNIKMVAQEIARAGAARGPGGDGEAGQAAALVMKIPVPGSKPTGRAVGVVEPRTDDALLFTGANDVVDRPGALSK